MEFSFGWFEDRTPEETDQLYSDRHVVQAILRSVSPLAQQYMLRLAFVEGKFLVDDIEAWCMTPDTDEHRQALDCLCELQFWCRDGEGTDQLSVSNHPQAQRVVQDLMCGEIQGELGTPCADPAAVSEFGRSQWGRVLDFMVNPEMNQSFLTGHLTSWIPQLLVDAGLMDCAISQSGDHVSQSWSLLSDGCQFLLDDTSEQIWKLLVHYLLGGGDRVSWAEQTGFDANELMGLLCRLTVLDPAEAYDVKSFGLTHCQKMSLTRDLRGCGLIYMESDHAKSFTPSPFATGHWDIDRHRDQETGIVLERNFRLYMHRAEHKQGFIEEALLDFFAQIDYTMPNLCAATITRPKVCSALKMGISIDFVVDFMTKHAHPSMRKGPKQIVRLPPNVVSQMQLWAEDYDKVKGSGEVLLISGFSSLDSFRKTCMEIEKRDRSLLLWRWAPAGQREGPDLEEALEGQLPYSLVVPDVREVREVLRRCQPTLSIS